MPRRCSVGARLSSTGCSRITSSRMSHTSGPACSTIFFAALMVVARPLDSSLLKMNGFNDPLTSRRSHEYDMQKKKFYTDGVVGGYGTVNGRQNFVFAYDFTILGAPAGPVP